MHEQVDVRKLGPDVLSKAAELHAVADPEPPRLGIEGIGVTILAEHGRTDDPGLAVIVREGGWKASRKTSCPFQGARRPRIPTRNGASLVRSGGAAATNRVGDHGVGHDDAPTRDSQRSSVDYDLR